MLWTPAFVQLRQRRGFGNFVRLLNHNVYNKSMKRPVLKPNLVVKIDKMLCRSLVVYIHLITSSTFKLSSSKLINSSLQKNNSGQIVRIMYYSVYNCFHNCENEIACSENFVKS